MWKRFNTFTVSWWSEAFTVIRASGVFLFIRDWIHGNISEGWVRKTRFHDSNENSSRFQLFYISEITMVTKQIAFWVRALLQRPRTLSHVHHMVKIKNPQNLWWDERDLHEFRVRIIWISVFRASTCRYLVLQQINSNNDAKTLVYKSSSCTERDEVILTCSRAQVCRI